MSLPPVRLCAAVGVAVVGLLAAGCGGDDSSSPLADPTTGPATSAPTSTPSAADDEARLRDLVAAYESALARVQETRAEDASVFAGVLTDELGQKYLANYRDNIYGKGLEMTGRWTLAVESVDVQGDTATIDTCLDGRAVYVVEAGQGIGADDQPQSLAPTTVEAVRADDAWLVSAVESQEGTCTPA